VFQTKGLRLGVVLGEVEVDTIERKLPRRMRLRVSAEKKFSTAFSHDPEGGTSRSTALKKRMNSSCGWRSITHDYTRHDTTTLFAPLNEGTHWTGRAMAKAAGISLRSVQRIWAAHDLQPHRVRSFKHSRDPQFTNKLVARRHRDRAVLQRQPRLGAGQAPGPGSFRRSTA
jgi:hypothetical protein